MKKFGRTIWIGTLAGLAFLGACVSNKGLTKTERASLEKERDSIQKIIRMRESSCVYGSPEVMREFSAETGRLRDKLKDINTRLSENDSKKKQ